MSGTSSAKNWRMPFASFARPTSPATVDADIRELSTLWYLIAALQGIFVAILVWIGKMPFADFGDPFVYAVGGYFIKTRKSRAVAVTLLLASLAAAYVTIEAKMGLREGGRNIVLALIVVLLGCRTVMVTWFYQRHMRARIRWLRVVWVSMLVAVVCAILDLIAIVAVMMRVEGLSEDALGAIIIYVPLVLVPILLGFLTRKWPFVILSGPVGSGAAPPQATPAA